MNSLAHQTPTIVGCHSRAAVDDDKDSTIIIWRYIRTQWTVVGLHISIVPFVQYRCPGTGTKDRALGDQRAQGTTRNRRTTILSLLLTLNTEG